MENSTAGFEAMYLHGKFMMLVRKGSFTNNNSGPIIHRDDQDICMWRELVDYILLSKPLSNDASVMSSGMNRHH